MTGLNKIQNTRITGAKVLLREMLNSQLYVKILQKQQQNNFVFIRKAEEVKLNAQYYHVKKYRKSSGDGNEHALRSQRMKINFPS